MKFIFDKYLHAWVLFGIFFLILISILNSLFLFLDYDGYSVVFLLFSIFISFLFYINRVSYASVMFIMNMTVFLFVGGRFFVYLFKSYDEGLFSLNYMANFNPTQEGESYIFLLVMIFIFIVNFSYLYFPLKKERNFNNFIFDKKILCLILLLSVSMYFISLASIYGDYLSVSSGSYFDKYKKQAENYDPGSGLIFNLMYCMFAFLYSRSNINLKIKYSLLFLLLILFSFFALMGQRGPFASYILLLVFLYFLNKKVSFFKITFSLSIAYFFMVVIYSFSSRSSNVEMGVNLLKFVYEQGITLGVISYGILGDLDYPIEAYISSLAPGISRLISFVNNGDIQNYYFGFGSYAAHMADSKMYENGMGLGWSIISGFYHFSAENIFIFLIFCFSWGVLIRKIDIFAGKKDYWTGVAFVLAPNLFFLARSEIKNVIHIFIIFNILYFIFYIFNKVLLNKEQSRRL